MKRLKDYEKKFNWQRNNIDTGRRQCFIVGRHPFRAECTENYKGPKTRLQQIIQTEN